MINVNYEKGADILKRCQTLQEYSRFIHMVRVMWVETGELETAILKTIDACMSQGILEEFLKKNGGDVVSFLFEELSREECESIREEDGFAKGKAEGEQLGLRKIAKKMKVRGFSVKEIKELTGLTEEEIEAIE